MNRDESVNLNTIEPDIEEISARNQENWMPGLYRRLIGLFELSEPPQEDELQPALYVMF